MYVQTLNNERKNVRIFIAADIKKADVSCKLIWPSREKSPGERDGDLGKKRSLFPFFAIIMINQKKLKSPLGIGLFCLHKCEETIAASTLKTV